MSESVEENEKFRLFCNKGQKDKVKITEKELYRFKELIYLRKEKKNLLSESSEH